MSEAMRRFSMVPGPAPAPRAGLCIAALLSACGSAPVEVEEPVAPRAPPLLFDLDGPTRNEVDSASTRGRTTVILFGATYDLATQVEAKQLEAIRHQRRPRVNVAMVVLETREYAPMAVAFQASLGLSYPVVMADDATRLGRGPFGSFSRIPTLIVLDAEGRPHSRSLGLLKPEELEQVLDAASRPAGGVAGAER